MKVDINLQIFNLIFLIFKLQIIVRHSMRKHRNIITENLKNRSIIESEN